MLLGLRDSFTGYGTAWKVLNKKLNKACFALHRKKEIQKLLLSIACTLFDASEYGSVLPTFTYGLIVVVEIKSTCLPTMLFN